MEVHPRTRFLPLAASILMPITFTISFTMSRTAGHITGFNYISDTGAVPSESCYFGQLLNIVGVLMGFCAYYMYKLVDPEEARERRAMYSGIVSGVGASLVANFQETNVIVIHIIGAVLAFGGACTYMWQRSLVSKCYKRLRITLAAIGTITLITCLTTGALAIFQFKGKSILHWSESDGGYYPHVISVVTEWLVAITIILFLNTQYIEMCDLLKPTPPTPPSTVPPSPA